MSSTKRVRKLAEPAPPEIFTPDPASLSETDRDYVRAARLPLSVQTGEFGPWKLERIYCRSAAETQLVGFDNFALLSCQTMRTMHQARGAIVMDDGVRELSRHLPIWRAAAGRVLVTGLGLGCVVRALLTKPEVTHVDVIEIDPLIIERIGPEFETDPRVTLRQANALTVSLHGVWDYAAHDLWHETKSVPLMHANLIFKHYDNIRYQTAWGMPKEWHDKIGGDFVSNPNI